jgi:hypothetical protein
MGMGWDGRDIEAHATKQRWALMIGSVSQTHILFFFFSSSIFLCIASWLLADFVGGCAHLLPSSTTGTQHTPAPRYTRRKRTRTTDLIVIVSPHGWCDKQRPDAHPSQVR